MNNNIIATDTNILKKNAKIYMYRKQNKILLYNQCRILFIYPH